MASHPHYATQEGAARSPMARWLREQAPVGTLFTTDSDHIARSTGHWSGNRRMVVMVELRALKEWKVIEYLAEGGSGSTVTVRVLI
jgi:hypothetical protein